MIESAKDQLLTRQWFTTLSTELGKNNFFLTSLCVRTTYGFLICQHFSVILRAIISKKV